MRLAVPHSGGENAPVSGQNPTAGTVGLIDGNTGANQSNSNRNSASRNSVTRSATTYKEKLSNVGMSEKQNEDLPKAVIYVRVSKKKQAEEGYSVDAQKTNCKNYTRMKNYRLVKKFVDEGVSATTHLWKRPAGKAMKNYIQKHDVKHIVVVKMDRLFRNVQDLLSTIDELEEMNVGLHLLEFNGQTLDTTSAMGRFFLTVIGGIAELESGQISERTKVVMKHIKDKNKRFTGEIYGWNCKDDDLTPNWHEQYVIDYMRDLYFGHGCSGYRISKILNELGEKGKLGGMWRSSTVIRTINYEFHKNRDKPEFTKPAWWDDAPFTDTIPWGTTEFLDIYPVDENEPPTPEFTQPKPTTRKGSVNIPKPIETLSADSEPESSEPTDINFADYIMNWDEF